MSATAAGRSPTLERVLRGELCSGCGLCASVGGGAVELAVEPPGFRRPRLLDAVDAVQEAAIARSCPGAEVAPWPADAHPVWGPLRQVLTGAATDPQVRFAGSSGGMLTALLQHALEAGLVDEVVQTRADPAKPIANLTVASTTPAEVADAAGSRYAPSSPLSEIETLLTREDRRYAFVGKPCDVGALRQLGTLDRRVAARFPVILSFFCGGIPSHAGTQAVLAEMGVDEGELSAFRYRGNGWPGVATATSRDGREATMSYARSWGDHLSKHVQFRCKICPDAVGGVADVACADAWYGGESGYPQFDEADGRSLVITRNAAGAALVEGALAAGRITLEPLDPRQIDLMQPAQRRRKALLVARFAALAVLLQPRPKVAGLKLPQAARLVSPALSLKNFLGTARRIVQGRK